MDGAALDAREGGRVKTVVFGAPRFSPLLRARESRPLAVTAALAVGQAYLHHYL